MVCLYVSFLSHVLHPLAAQARGVFAFTWAKKQKQLESRRQLVAYAKKTCQEIAIDTKERPYRAYIKRMFLVNQLNRIGLKPDDFKELREKEEVALLARRLENLSSDITANLTDEHEEILNRFWRALGEYDFTCAAIRSLAIAREWRAELEKLEAVRRKDARLVLYARRILVSTILIFLLNILLVANGVTPQRGLEADLMSLTSVILPVAGFWSLSVLGLIRLLIRLGDIPYLEARCKKFELQCYGRDRDFWDRVRTISGENPKTEDLKEIQQKQWETFKEIFVNQLEFDEESTHWFQ
jgi:hypothetical protein